MRRLHLLNSSSAVFTTKKCFRTSYVSCFINRPIDLYATLKSSTNQLASNSHFRYFKTKSFTTCSKLSDCHSAQREDSRGIKHCAQIVLLAIQVGAMCDSPG